MVEPAFFALTSTPSITPSRADDTLPLSAGGCCADDDAINASRQATTAADVARMRCMVSSSKTKQRFCGAPRAIVVDKALRCQPVQGGKPCPRACCALRLLLGRGPAHVVLIGESACTGVSG